jgi:glucose-6-phosphate-specific signal transduction histidine kinase
MAPDTPFGLGLTGIEERVQALGGALILTTRHPQGLRVQAWIPVQPDRSDSTSEHSRLATSPRP